MSDTQLSQIQVMLIEPSHTQQMIIKKHLEECGARDIECLTNGQDTLDAIRHCAPDLIISAMYLPDMTGVDLLHQIRADSNAFDMAFLLISSETNIRYLEPIRQAGAIGILPKPFAPQDLKIALSATLDFLNPKQLELDNFDPEDIRVLLVDDSDFSLKYITRLLNDSGIEHITTAHNGTEVIDLLNQAYFDLIITDFNMPKMDGLELTQHIRAHQDYTSTPILMVTSEQNTSRLAAVKQAGVSAILDKPFEPSSIKSLIASLLN